MVRSPGPLGVGICCSGIYEGSWISGPTESVIKAALDDADDQMYSWSWEFQPFQSEFDLPVALTHRQALDQLSEWRVNWVATDLAPIARAMLFDDTGFEEHRTFLGLMRKVEIRPIEGVHFTSHKLSIKLQSVRSAVTFKMQIEQSIPWLTQCDTSRWALAAGELLGGEFTNIDRRGWFAPLVEPGDGARDSFQRISRPEVPFHGDVIARARELAGSEECLAFIPSGNPLANETLPVAPWAWLRELQGCGPEQDRK